MCTLCLLVLSFLLYLPCSYKLFVRCDIVITVTVKHNLRVCLFVHAVPVSTVISTVFTLLSLLLCPLGLNIIGLILTALCDYLLLYCTIQVRLNPAGSPNTCPNRPDIRRRLVAFLTVRARDIYILCYPACGSDLVGSVGVDRCERDWYASGNNLRGTLRGSRKKPNAGR